MTDQTTNPDPISLSENDLLWLAIRANGGEVELAGHELFLPEDRSVTVTVSDDGTLVMSIWGKIR